MKPLPDHEVAEAFVVRARAAVVSRAHEFVRRHAEAPSHDLLIRALGEMRASTDRDETLLPSVHLPLLVALAVNGDERGVPDDLAVVTSFVELGADLLDHLADGELGEAWLDTPPVSVQLAGTAFLVVLPHLAISTLDGDASVLAEMHAVLARGLMAIGAGQQRDLELTGARTPASRAVLDAIAGKSGGRRAMYAELAACWAGADGDRRAALASFGRELGIARQLASDAGDLVAPGPSRDLARGARSWTIAWALEQLSGEPRARLLASLDACVGGADASATDVVVDQLRDCGALRRTLLEVGMHRTSALAALDRAAPGPRTGAAALLESLARGDSA